MSWKKFGRALGDVATGGLSYVKRKNKSKTRRMLAGAVTRGLKARRDAEQSFDKGVAKGQKIYDNTVNQDALDNLMANRSTAKKEIAARQRDMSRGLNARENAAMRASFEQQVRNAGAGARKQTAASIANSGMQGGVAQAQVRATENDIAQKRIQAARDQMMANVALKQQGLAAYENTINSQEATERKNLLNRLSTGLAGGQQNAQMFAAIRNMTESKKTDIKNSRDGLLGGNFVPGML